MFNVSALLLDDALKPATPLTNGAIDENHLIFDVVKAYKNYAKFLGPPDVILAGCDSYFRQLTETINMLFPVVNCHSYIFDDDDVI